MTDIAPGPLAETRFSMADQVWFAALSNDRNPMHMDEVAARRSMAGAPVVHGIHTLLWLIEALYRRHPDLAPLQTVKVNFDRMVYVGDDVRAAAVERSAAEIKLTVAAAAGRAMRVTLGFESGVKAVLPTETGHSFAPSEPIVLPFADMKSMAGDIPFVAGADPAAAFPAAARALGGKGVAALAASSFLVGMVCPGLHSIYRGLTLARAEAAPDGLLRFDVATLDPRFHLLKMRIAGGGWAGMVEAHARPEPAKQPDMAALAGRIEPGAFAGDVALVVGGSRGFGELTAKALAAGGAHVMVSYAMGEGDARRVQDDIRAHGGECDILRYDATKDAASQWPSDAALPTHVYYMATPSIFKAKDGTFVPARFEEFLRFYVTGFWDLCRTLKARGARPVYFYPSSVAVEDRPANMTEYAMAKAAGELLCADLETIERVGRMVVVRLPKLPTDQTASLSESAGADPLDVLLPVLAQMHKKG